MTHAERQKHVLRWVNARRKEAGLRATSRLSRGYQRDACLCVITRSLECVGVEFADFNANEGEVTLWGSHTKQRRFKEPDVAEFMRAFDAGEYPELVIPPTVVKINGKAIS